MRSQQKIINLYMDSSVHSIKHVVSIGSEEDLNQFWQYFHSDARADYKLLYSFISMMYAFSERLFKEDKETFFELIIEQSDEMFYLTVWNAYVSELLESLLQEQQSEYEYLRDKKRICIKLAKEKILEEAAVYKHQQQDRTEQIIASLKEEICCYQPAYIFLENEDKEEILNICDDLVDIMYRAQHIGLQTDIFIRLRSSLSMFSLNLMHYSQLSCVSNLIIEFSVLMNTYTDRFKQMNQDELALVEGFINNMERWAKTLFILGGADLHFMDNSLKADLDMIKMLVEEHEDEVALLDDIFDF